MTRIAIRLLSVLGFIVLVVALLLLAKTTQNSEEFGRLHYFIVLFNVAGLMLLLGLIFVNLFRLVRDYITGVPGARLKSRMIGMFAVLAAVPLVLVYLFSMYFLNKGINSYFDVKVTQGLDDALLLSQIVLDVRMSEHMERLEHETRELSIWKEHELVAEIEPIRRKLNASELIFIGDNNRVLAIASTNTDNLIPGGISNRLLSQVRSGVPLLDIEPAADGGLQIRAAVMLPVASVLDESRVVYARFPVGANIAELADSVQQTYAHHSNLEYLRQPLIDSFKLTLTLVLLVSLLLTLSGIFFIARRIVKPIQDLVAGTRAVAEGDFQLQLPEAKKDDIGFLVASFNNMTRRLSRANEIEIRSRAEVEAERANLEIILGRLSSGVIALEQDLTIRTVNDAARAILNLEDRNFKGEEFKQLNQNNVLAEQLASVCLQYLSNNKYEWREQVLLHGEKGQRMLSCACTPLPLDEHGVPTGYVVVFEDVTMLVQAQRESAWGEVARRLAHEIKNPLTPIQLSAERMRRKYLGKMSAQEADVLERATRTIVQQVETMKEMVDAFRDYARAPEIDLTQFDLNRLLSEVVELYRGGDPTVAIDLSLDDTLPEILADSGRLRQIMHNLLRNAFEALNNKIDGHILIITKATMLKQQPVAQIVLEDNGPGFANSMLTSVFEPYVTSKPKGTGLGLAIVKKLVEEHAGMIHIENQDSGGARVTIWLPINNKARSALIHDHETEVPKRESA